MKRYIKNISRILIILMMMFLVGCGAANNQSTNKSEATSTENTVINKKDVSKEVKVDKTQVKETKNEQSKQTTKVKKVDDSKKKTDNKVNKNEKVKVVEKKDISKNTTKTTANKVNKAPTKDNTFLLVISQESKGYTGKAPKIIFKKKIAISGNKSAMTYLRDNCDIRDKGGFIYEVNGIHNIYPIPKSKKTEEQKNLKILGIDWFLYVNGKKTSVGANDVYPKQNDELLLDIHEWDKRELSDR